MNRREFQNSTAALAALAAMSRLAVQTWIATAEAKSSEPAKDASGKVSRRKFGKIDIMLPLLGYGMLRLPAGNDREALQKLIDAAIAAGLNCFDVAQGSLPFACEVRRSGRFRRRPSRRQSLNHPVPDSVRPHDPDRGDLI